eukprot:CFRG7351T1
MTDRLDRILLHEHVVKVYPQLQYTRKLLRSVPLDTHKSSKVENVHSWLKADVAWKHGLTGKGTRVAIFDSGVKRDRADYGNIVEVTDWTDELSSDDSIGHGTFTAGVVGSINRDCPGISPDADLYILKVFSSEQKTYTSWFLDAFNHALHLNLDVLNLSIGGPDYLDYPFVEKIQQLSASGVVVVSAVGNQGPLYGTVTNPADQLDVIGVGSIDEDYTLSSFSSRGMTRWELPFGQGRPKPDIMTLGIDLLGPGKENSCTKLSGTSVASPLVSGVIALLLSGITPEKRKTLSPASIKQALIESAVPVDGANLFQQGLGRLNLLGAYNILRTYTPRVSITPHTLDLADCPYLWPYCAQPLFCTSLPYLVNVTVINGLGVNGSFSREPVWIPTGLEDVLQVSFTHSRFLWPWTGWLGVTISVKDTACWFDGTVTGVVRIVIDGSTTRTLPRDTHTLDIPMRVSVVQRPPRSKRLLWDQYHSLHYPIGHFPTDDLSRQDDPLDWHGDHPYTNFRGMFHLLRRNGYFLEISDNEGAFHPKERDKLWADVMIRNMSVIVLADWYNTDVIHHLRFYDENFKRWWTHDTGGCNVPALNGLLEQFGIAFGSEVLSGEYRLGEKDDVANMYTSGSNIVRFPKGGQLLTRTLTNMAYRVAGLGSYSSRTEAIMGLISMPHNGSRIVVYGDSNLIDEVHNADESHGHGLFLEMVEFAMKGTLGAYTQFSSKVLTEDYTAGDAPVPIWPFRDPHQHKYNGPDLGTDFARCSGVPAIGANWESGNVHLLPPIISEHVFKWKVKDSPIKNYAPVDGYGYVVTVVAMAMIMIAVSSGILLLLRLTRRVAFRATRLRLPC